MASSVLGLDNQLPRAVASNASFQNALDYGTDIWVRGAGNTAQSVDFLWESGTEFDYSQSRNSNLWVGMVANGSVKVTLSGYPDLAGNPSGIVPMGVYEFANRVVFQPVSPTGLDGTTPFAFRELTGAADTNFALRVSFEGDGQLVMLWLGIPLVLPYQWQTGGASSLLTDRHIYAPWTQAGSSGGLLSRPKPGRLAATMPNVSNDWAAENWETARIFMQRNPFFHSLFERSTKSWHFKQVAFASSNGDRVPPPIDMRADGFCTLALDAETYPDYSI